MYQILAIGVPLITAPYLSRVLGAEGLGEYAYMYTIAQYFGLFILFGLINYGSRTIAMVKDNPEELAKAFTSIYVMQLICSVFVVTSYIVYACVAVEHNVLVWIQGLYLLSVVLDINWFFFGMEKFQLTVTRNAMIKLMGVLSIFIFVRDTEDVIIYTSLMAGIQLLATAFMWPFVKRYTKFVKIDRSDILQHVKPNLTLFIPVLAISIYNKMDIIMLGSISGTTEVGYYTNAEKIIQIPLGFITAIGTVMLPRISNMLVSGKEEQIKQYFKISITAIMFLASGICFGIMGVADKFVPIYFGSGYEVCVLLLYVLLPCQLFQSFANVIRNQYLMPYKKDRIYIISVCIGAVVNLILNCILISRLGAAGVAIGTLVAEFTVCAYQAYMTRVDLQLGKVLAEIVPFLILGATMLLLILNLPDFTEIELFNMVIEILIGGIFYVSVSALLYITYIKKRMKN